MIEKHADARREILKFFWRQLCIPLIFLFAFKAEGSLFPFPKVTRAEEPNVLMLLDTSGSMNYRLDSDTMTWGDGSRPMWSGNSIIARYFGADNAPGENRTGNNDMRVEFNYHPNLRYIRTDDLTGISTTNRNTYFSRRTSVEPVPASGESNYKYPNDSRMYALKNVMFRLLNDESIYRGLRISLSTYNQTYSQAPFTPASGTNWYRWLPWGTQDRWGNWSGGDLQALNWSGGSDTGLLRESFVSTSDLTHLNNLRDWFDGNAGSRELRSIGATPLSLSIYSNASGYSTTTGSALQFFRAPGVITDPCQDNWYIILTDGDNTQGGGSPVNAVRNLCNAALTVYGTNEPAKKIKAFVIGLILPTNTSLAAVLNDMAAEGNTEAGTAYLVNDMQGLFDALRAIFAEIQKSSSGLAPLVSAPRSSDDEDGLYVVQYTSRAGRQWDGTLMKRIAESASDGTLSYSKAWEAAEQLSSIRWDARNIYTAFSGMIGGATNLFPVNHNDDNPLVSSSAILGIPAQADRKNFVQWLRGKDVYDEEEGKDELHKLWDVYNSGLVKVGPPSAPIWDPLYTQFRTAHKTRNTLLYAQSNSGMLHGFDDADGNERFAFIPPNVLYNGRLKGLRWSDGGTDYSRGTSSFSRYLLDGPVSVEDVLIGGQYRTLLLGLLGFGGAGVYALDVTSATPGSAKFLWAIENDIYRYDTANRDVRLKNEDERQVLFWEGSGNTTLAVVSHPHIPVPNTTFNPKYDYRRLRRTVGIPFIGRVFLETTSSNPTWVWTYIMGSGSTIGVHADYDSPGALYVGDIQDGSILRKFDVASPLTSSIVALSEGLYKEVRTFFAGDASGKVYKGDISLTNKDNWLLYPVLLFPNGTSGFSRSLNAIRLKQQTWIFAGTGDIAGYLASASDDEEYFAAVNITNVQSGSPLEVKNTTDNLFQLSAENGSQELDASIYPDRKGWFIKLSARERLSTPPKFFKGYVFFATFIPDVDICSESGTSRLYILNAKTGKSAWDPIIETSKKYKEYIEKRISDFAIRSSAGNAVTLVLPDGTFLVFPEGSINFAAEDIVGEPLYWKSR